MIAQHALAKGLESKENPDERCLVWTIVLQTGGRDGT
jgi:hypothetical protein